MSEIAWSQAKLVDGRAKHDHDGVGRIKNAVPL
jgi:hypothetical protein